MLKHNLDQNIISIISTSVINILKCLEIYSIFSSDKALEWVGPENFFNRAEEDRNKLELALEIMIDTSFLIDEIQATLEIHQNSFNNFSTIEHQIRDLKKIIQKNLKKDSEEEKSSLLNGILHSRVEKEKVLITVV